MAPLALAETGMPARLRAAIVHTVGPTYVAGGSESIIDFFLMSESPRPAVQLIEVITDSEVRKHRPVRLVLSGRPRSESVVPRTAADEAGHAARCLQAGA